MSVRDQRIKGTHGRESLLRILKRTHKISDTTSLIPPIFALERFRPKNFIVPFKSESIGWEKFHVQGPKHE